MTNTPFLSLIGIGEEGLSGLSAQAYHHLTQAQHVFGGRRHLALADSAITGQRHEWIYPIRNNLDKIIHCKPETVAVLASGDPFCYGIGSTIAHNLPAEDIQCFPVLSSFSLACATLKWSQPDCQLVSLCGRPLATLRPFLQEYTRLVILSANAQTPHEVADYMSNLGFSSARMHVLEALGGPQERMRTITLPAPLPTDLYPLHLIALETGPCLTPELILARSPGRADSLFEHDGQITRAPLRALTLAALQPRREEVLWDIGAGSGAIGIEWMLTHPSCKAIGIEQNPERAERAMRNAQTLGVPAYQVIQGQALEVLQTLSTAPHAIFIGGGCSSSLLDYAWHALPAGGRLVVNAVTAETEALLFDRYQQWGGSLSRFQAEYLTPLGRKRGFKPDRTITQYCITHP
ncbi:precorrin-6y C5,15-methyltransferase (decarboxylating) subunit CbiE [Entomobacter blattae]|uniref:Precorrin-6Y C(5,15)-methyltransferase n=1 Tax=Entomobacter blattae TaxID=2762277 RepID=A0A7H1NQ22_9PROT|nr:precorrin-6y C5,15-methyltransferase (decarboxylating) subunit CbiE [Entomobacter blattae]QNT77882.1 Precorrin-6Y C(5,15)-methyltransferase [Entomobacter blattae]